MASKPSKRRYQNIPGQASGDDDDHENPLASATSSEGEVEGFSNEVTGTAPATNALSVDEAIDRLGMGLFQYRILIAAGLCFAADAMEVLLLSFLSIVLKNEWHLSDDETAFITSTLFLGALVGTSILGPLADKHGRRPIFLLAATVIAVTGVGTSLAQSYEMLLVAMFIIGFGVGGLTVPFDTLAEFLPAQGRGTNLLLIEYFWTFGCLLVIVFAEMTLAHGKPNWRLFVILCALPCFLSIIVGYLYVPESVRWLVSEGRNEEALEIMREAARVNKLTAATPLTQQQGETAEDDNTPGEEEVDRIFPLGTQLTSDEDHSAENSCFDLMKPQWRKMILYLWGLWGAFGLGYYGAILSVTKVFDSESDSTSLDEEMWSNATRVDSEEVATTDFDYGAIFISSSAELVGTTMVIILVDRAGRIPSQVVSFALAGASIFMLCTLAGKDTGGAANDRWELVAMGFLLRALDMAATCTAWVMTAEILPTEIRSTGHASANAIARMGAFFSPFVVDILPLHALGGVMLVVHLFAAACVSQLPETKGASMGGGGHTAQQHDAIADMPAHSDGEEPDGLFVIDDEDDNGETVASDQGASSLELT